MKELFVKTSNPEIERIVSISNASKNCGTLKSSESAQVKIELLQKPEPLILVESTKDEEKAVRLAKNSARIFVKCPDWKVIPLENLIAKTRGKTKLIAAISSAEEAKLALSIMEIGVDGILLETDSVAEFQNLEKLENSLNEAGAANYGTGTSGKLQLEDAIITNVRPLGSGARACIDTCMMMKECQGMLVGSSSQGMFLVQAEVALNKLVNTRPFRVNAGAVSLYTIGPGNRTKYLEEINAGDEVLVFDKNGNAVTTNVTRSKIEIRPLILLEASSKNGKIAKALLQNAETIRIVTPVGSKAVTELAKGDKVLARFEDGGRHFGMQLKEETIIEK